MGLLINAAAFNSVSVFTISIALAHLVALSPAKLSPSARTSR
jgi:hypothetical protein